MDYTLACDIGGTTCKIGVFQQDELINYWVIDTDTSKNGQNILPNINQALNHYLTRYHINKSNVTGIGIGVPGPVNFQTGELYNAINLNWNKTIPVGKIFNDLSHIETIIDNDANLAALGEQYYGAGNQILDVAMLTFGTGIGGGIIINGELIHGHYGAAGEVGHLFVDHSKRFKCNCGKYGCFETVASATGLVNLAHYYYSQGYSNTQLKSKIIDKSLTAKDLFEFKEDQLANIVIEEMIEHISIVMSHIAALSNPQRFIFGGGVSKGLEPYIETIMEKFKKNAFTSSSKNVDCVIAKLGNNAGIYGCKRLVEQKLTTK